MSWFYIPWFKKSTAQPAPLFQTTVKHTMNEDVKEQVFTTTSTVFEDESPSKDGVPLGEELEGEAAAAHIAYSRIYSDYCMAKPSDYTDEYKGWLVRVLVKNIGFQCRKCGVGITQANCRCNHCEKYDAASYDYFTVDGYALKERRMYLEWQEYDKWYKELEAHWEGKPCPGCHDRTGCKIINGFCGECQYYWSCAFDPALPQCRYQFLPNPPRRKIDANCVHVFG
jgi:hypothetical protein